MARYIAGMSVEREGAGRYRATKAGVNGAQRVYAVERNEAGFRGRDWEVLTTDFMAEQIVGDQYGTLREAVEAASWHADRLMIDEVLRRSSVRKAIDN